MAIISLVIPITDKQSALLGVMSKSKISSPITENKEAPISSLSSKTKIPS